jgi:molecular chaperone GrpE (heat shock protein)
MLTKVTMRLKLNDAATEDNIVKAIDAIEDRAKKAEEDKLDAENKAKDKAKADGEEMDKLKAKLKEAKDAHEKAKADYDECKQKLDAMEQDKLAAENAAKEEKVKSLIEGFAKVGRIKNEATSILEWTNTAKVIGYERVKSMIEALPMNRDAVKIIDAAPLAIEKGQLPTTSVGLAVKNKLKREGKL